MTHCWKDGLETEDGCSTTCFLESGHGGDHEWFRDDKIIISFADENARAARVLSVDVDNVEYPCFECGSLAFECRCASAGQ